MYKRKLLSAALATMSTTILTTATHAAPEATRKTHDTTKLMVLFVPRNLVETMLPSELVSTIRVNEKTPRSVAANARFGFPSRASRLLGDTTPEPQIVLPKGAALTAEQVVQQYLLLEYDSPQMAANALRSLKGDPGVLWVEHPAFMRLSATIPTDPGAAQGAYTNPFDYQWALGALNLYAAWDKARGNAYVGHVDVGVKTGEALPNQSTTATTFVPNPRLIHPDLTQSFRPHRIWSAINSQNMPSVGNVVVVDDFLGGVNPSNSIARGHGTHTAGIIAANTTYSGSQPGYPNPPSLGVSGVCWNCSLHVAKINETNDSAEGFSSFNVAAAIGWSISTGVQVINISFGGVEGPNCIDSPYNVICASLTLAAQREVVVVASAGNTNNYGLDFPASDSRTIPVGGIDFTGHIQYGQVASRFSQDMAERGLVAPGKDVLSTVYPGQVYDPALPCGDGYGRFAGQGFGPCSGTSMAAPFVTGIVALMRSVNPLLTATEIRTLLRSSASRTPAQDADDPYHYFYGAGKPDALKAIDAVLGNNTNPPPSPLIKNRLTPLFSMQTAYPTTANPRNYLYTTVPQVGATAYNGNFLPVEIGAGSYAAYGNSIAGYPSFPGGGPAKAQVWIFTTHVNPYSQTENLRPLYRLSRRCYVGALVCNSDAIDVDHFYTNDYAEVQSMIAMGWGHSYDGIEGYVVPLTTPPPSQLNPVLLMRALAFIPGVPGYKHAIFPASKQTEMAALGYLYLPKTLGYVFENNLPGGAKPAF